MAWHWILNKSVLLLASTSLVTFLNPGLKQRQARVCALPDVDDTKLGRANTITKITNKLLKKIDFIIHINILLLLVY
jgi:hypothetical protein